MVITYLPLGGGGGGGGGGGKQLLTSIGILGTCMKEAPEFSSKRRKVVKALPPPSTGSSGPARPSH